MPSSVAPPAPPVAAELFGAALPSAERYAALLASAGVERGLIGPREVARLWDRHLLNCVVLSELIPERATVIDVGSGAGLPGVVLAIARPDLRMTLLEPLLRRATFLHECVAELRLANTRVHRGRAEEQAGTLSAEVVTARAVASLDRLAKWTIPLLEPDGALLALKGERADSELAEAGPVLETLGVRSAEVVVAGRGKVEPPATVVRVTVGRSRRRPPTRPSVRGSGRGTARRRGNRGRAGGDGRTPRKAKASSDDDTRRDEGGAAQRGTPHEATERGARSARTLRGRKR